jgi:hypothetical protein
MTLTLELSDDQTTALQAKAAAEGLSVEAWLLKLAERTMPNPLVERPRPTAALIVLDSMGGIPPEIVETLPRRDRAPQTPADIVLFHMRQVPPEIMGAMPTDGASQHDHYIYGTPKREV